jgi:type IV pilus assembly protein PilN
VRLLPDGVYLRSIKQTNQTINLTGYAQSNARVSTLMRKLESSPWLGLPSLVEIKASKVNNARLNAFSLNVTLVRSSQSAADGNSTQDIAKL